MTTEDKARSVIQFAIRSMEKEMENEGISQDAYLFRADLIDFAYEMEKEYFAFRRFAETVGKIWTESKST